MASGFSPAEFWPLTPRTYDLHMRGAARRIEREIEISNRHAYNTAALTGAAFAGKLPKFERVFRPKLSPGRPQPAAILEANLRALAIAWGATLPEKVEK